MPRIGNEFPPEIRRAFVLEKLVSGCVVRIQVKFPQKTKPKFLVLVAEDDSVYWTFIVNSEIHPFIRNREHLYKSQVAIDAASHTFLTHDSYLACHEILKLRREEVIQELISDTSSFKGNISVEIREQILAAIKSAITLNASEKRQILLFL